MHARRFRRVGAPRAKRGGRRIGDAGVSSSGGGVREGRAGPLGTALRPLGPGLAGEALDGVEELLA